jgi:hypothetical protein
MRKEQAAAE